MLKALVQGDMDEYQSTAPTLDPATDEATRSLTLAGLTILVDELWSETTPASDIRLWVADFRNFMERQIGEIDPVSCERMIVGTINGDPSMIAAVPREQRTSLIALLTFKLAYDKKMSDAELEEFLDEAEETAADEPTN